MPSNARGWRFRNLSPRILETRLHPFPLGHHHFLSPPRLQVPQVARPRSEGPRVSENNELLVSGQSPGMVKVLRGEQELDEPLCP